MIVSVLATSLPSFNVPPLVSHADTAAAIVSYFVSPMVAATVTVTGTSSVPAMGPLSS